MKKTWMMMFCMLGAAAFLSVTACRGVKQDSGGNATSKPAGGSSAAPASRPSN